MRFCWMLRSAGSMINGLEVGPFFSSFVRHKEHMSIEDNRQHIYKA